MVDHREVEIRRHWTGYRQRVLRRQNPALHRSELRIIVEEALHRGHIIRGDHHVVVQKDDDLAPRQRNRAILNTAFARARIVEMYQRYVGRFDLCRRRCSVFRDK